jgi:hypothetical protein
MIGRREFITLLGGAVACAPRMMAEMSSSEDAAVLQSYG